MLLSFLPHYLIRIGPDFPDLLTGGYGDY